MTLQFRRSIHSFVFQEWTLEKIVRFSLLPIFTIVGGWQLFQVYSLTVVAGKNTKKFSISNTIGKNSQTIPRGVPIFIDDKGIFVENEWVKLLPNLFPYEDELDFDFDTAAKTSSASQNTTDESIESDSLQLSSFKDVHIPYRITRSETPIFKNIVHFVDTSRYAIENSQITLPRIIVRSAQLYSNVFPIWAISGLFLSITSRTTVKHTIRCIRKTQNTKRLKDVQAIDNLKPNLFDGIHFLQENRSIAYVSDLLNQLGFSSLEKLFIQETLPLVGRDKYVRVARCNYLFVGPSGTGKTLLTQAIAGEARVNLFWSATSELKTSALGTSTARLRELFRQANKSSPCVMVLDGLDLIGSKRNEGISGPIAPSELQLFTELLVQVDGIQKEQNAGNILIATAPSIDSLDPALIRPGRFNRIIQLELPNRASRIQLMKFQMEHPSGENTVYKIPWVPFQSRVHEVQMKSTISWNYFAQRTQDYSQADLVALTNESLLQAVTTMIEHNKPVCEHTFQTLENSICTIEDRKKSTIQTRHHGTRSSVSPASYRPACAP